LPPKLKPYFVTDHTLNAMVSELPAALAGRIRAGDNGGTEQNPYQSPSTGGNAPHRTSARWWLMLAVLFIGLFVVGCIEKLFTGMD
jgi:hypothetical protein